MSGTLAMEALPQKTLILGLVIGLLLGIAFSVIEQENLKVKSA